MPRPEDPDINDSSAAVHVTSNPITRGLVFILGIICVGFGFVGLVMPILPGFPLLLAAAYLFSKSSVRYYNWLMNHPKLGPVIRDYNAGKGIPMRAKIMAVSTLWLAVFISVFFFIPIIYGKVAFIIIATGVSWHLLSLPTSQPD